MNHETALVLLPVFWPNLPPLGLAALKGYLKQNQTGSDILDFNNYFFRIMDNNIKKQWQTSSNPDFENSFLAAVKKNHQKDFNLMIDRLLSYKIIGFSCYKSNFSVVKEVAGILKAKNPEIKIIFGGPEIASQYFKFKDGLAKEYSGLSDLFVVGEGEHALLAYITEKKMGEKVILFNEIQNPDDFSCADYSDFNLNDYPKKGAVSLIFSRGCIRNCGFCSERLLYKKFRTYPVDKIIDSIRELKKEGIKNFIFNDSLINGDLEAFENLLDNIISNFGSINWEAQIAVRNAMPDSLFKKMKTSGCYNLFVGLESGCNNTLRNMNKGFTAADAALFFKKLNSADLNFGVSLIVGFPGETIEDYKESLYFLIRNKALIKKIEQINPYVYYEGTSIERKADYRINKESIHKVNLFIETIKKEGFKYTNAFMKNLVEEKWK
ncbi:MAG: radical SAM protein [Elusimicrobia bacterium]|nr:radical SAM protein [Candidatus Liberimonas magnetica]